MLILTASDVYSVYEVIRDFFLFFFLAVYAKLPPSDLKTTNINPETLLITSSLHFMSFCQS